MPTGGENQEIIEIISECIASYNYVYVCGGLIRPYVLTLLNK